MARAVIQKQAGEPLEVLELVQKPKPGPPAAGQVLVRITVRPVNPYDFLIIRTGSTHLQLKAGDVVTVGCEGFGIVEEVGEGVTKFKPGQRVVPLLLTHFRSTGNGSWQDYIELPEADVFGVPDGVPDDVAAQFVINPWTVYALLKVCAVPRGQYLLQTAAGSVLGRQLIQMAKHWGIKTINVVRRDDLKEELKDLGADEVINSTTEDLVARVKEITGGKGAYAAVDAVSGELTKKVANSVRDGGEVVVYGFLSGHDITLSIFDLLRKVRIRTFISTEYTDGRETEVATEVMKMLEDKIVEPLVGKKFSLTDFQVALVEAEKDARGDKQTQLFTTIQKQQKPSDNHVPSKTKMHSNHHCPTVTILLANQEKKPYQTAQVIHISNQILSMMI